MTATAVDTRTATLSTEDPVKTLDQEAINLIIKETGCTRVLAEQALGWMRNRVKETRRLQNKNVFSIGHSRIVLPTNGQMTGPVYKIIDLIMPHGKFATPGTAHAAVEAAVIDRSKDEFALRHAQLDVDHVQYCTVEVCVEVVHIN